jgi:DNA-binding NarL/FixJ family response regulator
MHDVPMKPNPLVLMVVNTATEAHKLADLLPAECRIELVGNGTDALAAARHHPMPDLLLLDFVLPDMAGLDVCRRLKRSSLTRAMAVIFVSATDDAAREAQALDLQADDCITHGHAPAVARARIRNRLLAKVHQPAATAAAASVGLGQRQTEVLSLIAEGLTSAEIGVQLSIAKGTVEVHRENIMRKLDVHNIAGLVKYAIRHGLAHA